MPKEEIVAGLNLNMEEDHNPDEDEKYGRSAACPNEGKPFYFGSTGHRLIVGSDPVDATSMVQHLNVFFRPCRRRHQSNSKNLSC